MLLCAHVLVFRHEHMSVFPCLSVSKRVLMRHVIFVCQGVMAACMSRWWLLLLLVVCVCVCVNLCEFECMCIVCLMAT